MPVSLPAFLFKFCADSINPYVDVISRFPLLRFDRPSSCHSFLNQGLTPLKRTDIIKSARQKGGFAGVLELADETDSKSVVSDGVWVRVPPPAPKSLENKVLFFLLVFGFRYSLNLGRSVHK